MRNFSLLPLFIGLMLFVSSCSKDDDKPSDEEYSKLIVGTWQYVSPIDCEKCDTNSYMIFQENGVLIEHEECENLHCDCQACHAMWGKFEYDEDCKDSWKIEDGYLTIGGLKDSEDDFFPDEITYEIVKLNDEILKYEILGITGTWKRVK